MKPTPDADTPWYVTAGQAEARRMLTGRWLRVIADKESFYWAIHILPELEPQDIEGDLAKILQLEAASTGALASGDAATYEAAKAAAERAALDPLTRGQRQAGTVVEAD